MASPMRRLCGELASLEDRLREGGGPDKAAKQHAAGKLTARERVAALIDPGSFFLEIGLLLAYDRYDGQAPAAGVITGVGRVAGRPVVAVANDATVKAGAWWPETIHKILRAQEIAMRNRLPIIYLVDSAGVNLPYQDGIFPGQYGAGRIFLYNSRMRQLRIPQIAAVMGMCIAGGAYLPALSDVIYMVEGASFMGLGGPNLVKGATGQAIDAESLGGASMHTSESGVAHIAAKSDQDCLKQIRARVADLPGSPPVPLAEARLPAKPAELLYDLMPEDHRLPYDAPVITDCLIDAGSAEEFQPRFAPELMCLTARIQGRTVAILANRRGFVQKRIGGIIYEETARKAAYFTDLAERHRHTVIYIQDVSGFMVGAEAERSGIIRSGAQMVESMACLTVPKIVLTVNHASGAGYYAMGGQGFDPNFTFGWPTARIGVMEGDSAVMAIHGPEIEKHKRDGKPVPAELEARMAKTREDYERWLDAKHAAARGHVDALIDPLQTRQVIAFALEACHAGVPA